MRAFKEIEGLISSKWEIFKSILSMVKLEAKLAGLSLIHVLASVVILFVVLITTWGVLITLAGYGIYKLYPSPALAISSALVLNLIVIGILAAHLISCAKTMTFDKTRKLLFDKESREDDLQETTQVGDRAVRKRITSSQD